ncbi:MAG: hypothetical protein US36_C0021G0003 [Candidatus Wolfebacteria bacterium GW2011_GWC1_37_10]|uniref:Uncharacterized protein n=1 Tax=Candidatus Wolfebacteria bacterium GW2011_GWC1_37_10 TaxID=1619010 RepID=A0A0G0IZI4_9BACT|nr:MAG: hypothetical protein US36_C0021G0003 [Candidatus Wolfebacteria bacterium GW2011_GWC1_37_10]
MNNENTKKYLNIAIIIAMLGFVYSVWIYAGAYSRSIQPSSFRSFSASGEGKITAIPDVAQFTLKTLKRKIIILSQDTSISAVLLNRWEAVQDLARPRKLSDI